jgi:hypothetical protein
MKPKSGKQSVKNAGSSTREALPITASCRSGRITLSLKIGSKKRFRGSTLWKTARGSRLQSAVKLTKN